MSRFALDISVKILLVTCVAASMVGCRTAVRQAKRLFCEEERVDSAAIAKFWDGPRVGPGMVLKVSITTPTAKPVVMDVTVDQHGEVVIPYLLQDPVMCDGLTLDEFKKKLVKEYSVYYRQPQITVNFVYSGTGVSPWGTVTVMGEVGTPGPVNMPPTMDLTVTKVIQLAGNLRPFADRSSIVVTRCDKEGRQTRTEVDFDEIGKDGRFDKDMVLRAGDVVYVPETWY